MASSAISAAQVVYPRPGSEGTDDGPAVDRPQDDRPAGTESREPDRGERRRSARRRVLKAGRAAYNERYCSFPCTVRDMSETGARLRSDHVMSIPDTFELIIELDGLIVRCAVIWRKGLDMGVSFVGPPRKEGLRRLQVVSESASGRPVTLRRRYPPGSK